MNNPFKPRLSISQVIDEDIHRKNYYTSWKKFNRSQNSPFIAIDNVFKEKYLNKLEAGPLRLYLYFAFAAKNQSGHSWHSVATIADYFGTQTRTIDNWIKALVDEGLIYRQRAGKKSNTTYLIPFSHTLLPYNKQKKYKTDSQSLLNDCLKMLDSSKHIYGEVVKVYHFFQWATGKHDVSSHQDLFVLCKRKDIVTVIKIALTKSDDMVISEDEVEEIIRFESPFEFNGEKIIGLAYPDNPSFRSIKTAQQLVDTLVDFADTERWQFDELPQVKYDHFEILFPEENEIEETTESAEE